MIESYSKEEAQYRKTHHMEWVALDDDGRLIDHDVDLGILDKRLESKYGPRDSRERFTFIKSWHLTPVGGRLHWKGADWDNLGKEGQKNVMDSMLDTKKKSVWFRLKEIYQAFKQFLRSI